MRRSLIFTLAITACSMTLTMLPASTLAQAASSVAKETTEAWDAVKAYTVEKKNDAVAYGKKIVGETDTKIEELQAKAAQSTGEAKAAHEKNMQELKAKRAQAAAKLDEMGKASAGAWDATKDGFANAYKDLQQAYNRAADKFKDR